MSPDERRAQIIASARAVFLENGFVGTRVRDIAARAGVTENLVYLRFATKDEIYQAAVAEPLDHLVDRLVAETGKLSEGGGTRQEKFEQFHKTLLSSMLDLTPLLAVALFSVPETGRAYYADIALPRFTEAITEVISDVTGWEADELALDVLVEGTIGLHFGLALGNLFGTRRPDVSQLAHQLALLFGNGITSRRQLRPKATRSRKPRGAPAPEVAPVPAPPNGRMRAEDRRADIARAARDVFLERGFAAARTKEMAERAGITEQFLFRVFNGKEDLYTAAIEDRVEELLTQLAAEFGEIAARNKPGIETLRAINTAGLSIMAELAPLIVIALFSEMERGRAFYRRSLIPTWRKVQKHLAAIEGWDTTGVDPAVLAQAVFGIHFGTAVHHFLVNRPLDVDEVSHRLTQLIASGIR